MFVVFKQEILLLGIYSSIQIFAKTLCIRMSITVSFKCNEKKLLSIQQDRIMISTRYYGEVMF